MAIASGIGAQLDATPGVPPHAFWFGEDQARYVVTARAADAGTLIAEAKAAGVPVMQIGVTGGNALALPGESPVLFTALSEKFEGWLPAYMAGAAPELAVTASSPSRPCSRARAPADWRRGN